MMERRDHNNPWADKLQDIRLPEEHDSWRAMEAVLDQEMPLERKRDGRRWVLLIILLLLLLGVCNCPGRRKTIRIDTDVHSGTTTRAANRMKTRGAIGGAEKITRMKTRTDTESVGSTATGNRVWKVKPMSSTAGKKKVRSSSSVEKEDPVRPDEVQADKGPPAPGKSTDTIVTGPVKTPPGEKKTVPGEKKTPARKSSDSVAAAARKAAQPDSILDMKGWAFGGGVNHFFTVGQQQQSDYNSNGTTGGLRDYIPVPMVRYYFSRKLFVQAEAQFNAPQYTTKNLLANRATIDTIVPGLILQSDLYIKKLFYFNLPLSVHYSLLPGLYLGGGIQYARLTNGVALYQGNTRNLAAPGNDSLAFTKVQSFKHDSTFQKLRTNEFRLLLDLDYTYKRFIVGVRYNRALSKFLDVKISGNQVSQSRNSSFQAYIRYIIWDRRKKTLLPK